MMLKVILTRRQVCIFLSEVESHCVNSLVLKYRIDFIKAGRYCEWAHKTVDQSSTTPTFEEYTKTLRLICDEGQPAYMNWTVASDTPDLVYYQVLSLTSYNFWFLKCSSTNILICFSATLIII